MLRPLFEGDFPVAAALLTEGFPVRTRAFWDTALERLRRYSGNAACGIPLGQLLLSQGEPVGVALTPASVRTAPGCPTRRLINFSSWYIRPEHRWRAAMMFRHIVSDSNATYLDLTPSLHVQPMLPLFGFRPISVGFDVVPTPLTSVGLGGGAHVRDYVPTEALPPYSPSAEQLLAHKEVGCVPLVMEHAAGNTLFVYRSRPMRRLPAARLMYVGDHEVLHRHLPVLARFALMRGMAVLTWDARSNFAVPRWGVRREANIWYARGELPDNCTDFIGTELAFLGV